MVLTHSHCESSLGLRDECRTAPDGCRPLDQAGDAFFLIRVWNDLNYLGLLNTLRVNIAAAISRSNNLSKLLLKVHLLLVKH